MFRAAVALPEPVQRFLAGPRVLLDGQTLATDVQLVLRLQRTAKLPDVATLPIADGRVMLDRQATMAGGLQPVGAVRDLDAGGRPARLYTPTTAGPGSPLMVFLHGGGFVYGGLESHEAPCRFLAERVGMRVLAVDYRMAPEHPFPAAYDDAVAAYRWAVANPDALGGRPSHLLVGGDSAGGNLAAEVALAAAQEGLPLDLQLLVYPMTDAVNRSRSREMFGAGYYLTTAFMDVATTNYTPDIATRGDAHVSPLLHEVPEGLAPAYVVTAGYDPLRDEGEAYARHLADAGVDVELRRFPDQIHGFLNTLTLRSSRACVAEIAAAVRRKLV